MVVSARRRAKLQDVACTMAKQERVAAMLSPASDAAGVLANLTQTVRSIHVLLLKLHRSMHV
jgi:hypothetical protein